MHHSLRYLLADLFEANTFWELAAKQVMAEQTETGAWQVTLDAQARKVVVDIKGVETEVPMDDLVEVGVFAAAESGGLGEPLYLGMRRVRSGEQRITVTVPRIPSLAGIDPRNLLIDVKAGNNLKEITSAKAFPIAGGDRSASKLIRGSPQTMPWIPMAPLRPSSRLHRAAWSQRRAIRR